MEWSTAYLGCFVLGLVFVSLSALVGKLGGGDHDGGGHDGGGHDADLGDATHEGGGAKLGLPLFSPTVLAVFVGMFGAGGLFLNRYLGIETLILHLAGAAAISGASGLGVSWMMLKLLTQGETSTLASHREMVGRGATVIAAIRGADFGEIAYESGGTRQTLIARSLEARSFAQGDPVQVVKVEAGVAWVGPPGAVSGLSLSPPGLAPAGVPVKQRLK